METNKRGKQRGKHSNLILILCSCLLDDEQKELLTKISTADQEFDHLVGERDAPPPPTPTSVPQSPTPLPTPLSPSLEKRHFLISPGSSSTSHESADRDSWLSEWSKKHHEQPVWSREVLFLVTAPLSPPNTKKQFLKDSSRKQHLQQNVSSDKELIVVPAAMTKGLCAHELTVGRFVASPTARISSQSIASPSPTSAPSPSRVIHQHQHEKVCHSNGASSSSERRKGTCKASNSSDLCSCSDLSCSLGVSVRPTSASASPSLTTRGSRAVLRPWRDSDGGGSVGTAFNLHS